MNKYVLPRAEKRNEATALDMVVMEVLDEDMVMNLSAVMIKHIPRQPLLLRKSIHCRMGFCSLGYFLTLRSHMEKERRGPKIICLTKRHW